MKNMNKDSCNKNGEQKQDGGLCHAPLSILLSDFFLELVKSENLKNVGWIGLDYSDDYVNNVKYFLICLIFLISLQDGCTLVKGFWAAPWFHLENV